MKYPHTFKADHILRNEKNIPLGRAILLDEESYERGEPIPLVLLTISAADSKGARGKIFYVDELPYRVPDDLPEQKVTVAQGKYMVNNFTLMPEKP